MMLRFQRALSSTFAKLSLGAMLAHPDYLSAAAEPPQLTVRMYSRVEVSPWLLDAGAAEATRLLSTIPVRLSWLNCAAPAHPAKCESPETPADLTIRLLSKPYRMPAQTHSGWQCGPTPAVASRYSLIVRYRFEDPGYYCPIFLEGRWPMKSSICSWGSNLIPIWD